MSSDIQSRQSVNVYCQYVFTDHPSEPQRCSFFVVSVPVILCKCNLPCRRCGSNETIRWILLCWYYFRSLQRFPSPWFIIWRSSWRARHDHSCAASWDCEFLLWLSLVFLASCMSFHIILSWLFSVIRIAEYVHICCDSIIVSVVWVRRFYKMYFHVFPWSILIS